MANYHIFTDGSSRGNPGAGGWGMVVLNEQETEIVFFEHDSDEYTTNNRMELKAMICAMGYAESNPHDYFIIYSDSAYVVNSYNSWMTGWAANGWRNSKKAIVENVDLMQALYEYKKKDFPNFEVKKCSGHSGDIGNELADAAATKNWKKFQELVDAWEIEMPRSSYSETIGENWFPID